MLKRKHNTDNEDWLRAYQATRPDASRVNELLRKAKRDARLVFSAYGFSRVGICWSGGKDSIVLHDVLRRIGITPEVAILVRKRTEYPEFNAWVDGHKPSNTVVVEDASFDLEWIDEHPEYLFPTDPAIKTKYTASWNAAFEKEYTRQNLDAVFIGRRVADGNFCAKDGNGLHVQRKGGIHKIDLIADWSHEDLLCYIKTTGLELPPTYNYPNGWKFGTHPWTERDRVNDSYEETLDEVWAIDPSILVDAMDKVELIRAYMEVYHG